MVLYVILWVLCALCSGLLWVQFVPCSDRTEPPQSGLLSAVPEDTDPAK